MVLHGHHILHVTYAPLGRKPCIHLLIHSLVIMFHNSLHPGCLLNYHYHHHCNPHSFIHSLSAAVDLYSMHHHKRNAFSRLSPTSPYLTSLFIIIIISDDRQALIWDITVKPKPIEDPILGEQPNIHISPNMKQFLPLHTLPYSIDTPYIRMIKQLDL